MLSLKEARSQKLEVSNQLLVTSYWSRLSKVLLVTGYSLLVTPLVFAASPLSSPSYKILRNDHNIGGSTSPYTPGSSNYRLFCDVLPSAVTTYTSTNFKIMPGIGNLIVHPNAIINLTGFESEAGEITLMWTSPRVMDGYDNPSGKYIVKWTSSGTIDNELNYDTATIFGHNWTPLAHGNDETGKVITGLMPGATIYISIKVQDDEGNRAYISSGIASRVGIFVSSRPTLPDNFVAVPSTSAINWAWKDNAGNELGYRVMASTGGTISGNLQPSTTFFPQNGLSANTSFAAYVQAFNHFWISSTTALSTYTLAAVPAALSISSVTITSMTITLENPSVVGNPSYTEFAILNVETGQWVQGPNFGKSSLDVNPVWLTYSQWGAANGIFNIGLQEDTTYTYKVKARNVLLVETALGLPSLSTTTLVGNPEVLASTPVTSVWVNYTTASFRLGGSRIFHYRYNTNEVDKATPDDNYVTYPAVLITTVTADGTNYLHIRGENSYHNYVNDYTYGPIKVDTTPPANVFIAGITPDTFTITVERSTATDPLSGLIVNPYEFQTSTDSAFATFTTSSAFSLLVTSCSLLPNTSYFVHFRVHDVAGNASTFSATVTTATLAAIPSSGPITNILITSVTVSWENSYNNPNDTMYTLQRSTSPNFIGTSLTSTSTLSLLVTSYSLLPNTSYYFRTKATNRYSLDTTWVGLGSTVTHANAVTISFIDWVDISSAGFSWSVPAGNPSDTRYLVEISSDDFSTVYKSSETVRSMAIIKPLRPSTDYKVRIAVLNRLGVRTPHTGVGAFTTKDVSPLAYEIGVTSMTIIWSGNVASPGSEYLVEVATYTASGWSSYAAQSWATNISSLAFTSLSINRRYSFNVSWRESSAGNTVFMISGDTRTFATIPIAPMITENLFVNPSENPTVAPNDTEFAVYVTVDISSYSPHDKKYIPLDGNMNSVSNTPIWGTYSQWGGASGVELKNLISGSGYNFKIKARNGNLVETNFSTTTSVLLFPTAPKVVWKMNLPQSSWINQSITSFTVVSSIHYHYRFNQNENDTDNVSKDDPGFFANEVTIVTATAEGPWFFHTMGDAYTFQDSSIHYPLGWSKFKINIDTTLPTLSSLKAQFSPSDTMAINDNENTPHKQPYFTWDSLDNSDTSKASGKIAPIAGYSVIFSTGTDPGDGAVPDVIVTTRTNAYFSVEVSSWRPTAAYYLRVKAKDSSGNWGPSSLFIYKVLEDVVKPKHTFQAISSVKDLDGRYLSVKSSVTIRVQFDKAMKEETVISTQNAYIRGIRDNLAGEQNRFIVCNLSYDSDSHFLQFEPSQPLPRGWLFELIVSTSVKDLAGNPLENQLKVQFETLMDRTVFNRIKASDGKTFVDIPSNALPEDASVSVNLISGGVSPSPSSFSSPLVGEGVGEGSLVTSHQSLVTSYQSPVTSEPPGSPLNLRGSERGLVPSYSSLVTPLTFHSPQYTSQQSMDIANQKIVDLLGSYAQPVTIREFIALSETGQLLQSNFQVPVTLTIPYSDTDNDGYVDGTNPKVRIKKLALHVLDDSKNIWKKIPNGSVDANNKVLSSEVAHFSVYAVLGAPETDISQVYAYPVPFRPSAGHTKINFSRLPDEGTIRIYSVSGELINTLSFNSPVDGELPWDVTNSNGEKLGSDVFIYVVQNGDNKKFGKLMIVR